MYSKRLQSNSGPVQVHGTPSPPQAHTPPPAGGQVVRQRHQAQRCVPQRPTPVKAYTDTPRPIGNIIDNGHTPSLHSALFVLREMQQHYWCARQGNGGKVVRVAERDFELIGKLVGSMLSPEARADFDALAPDLKRALTDLDALRGRPGQQRYAAWTRLCSVLKASSNPGIRNRTEPTGPSRIPASAPPRATPCEASRRGLMAQRDLFDARVMQGACGVNRPPQRHEWAAVHRHVTDIVGNPDKDRYFSRPQQQALHDLLHFLNQQPFVPSQAWGAWISVKNALPTSA